MLTVYVTLAKASVITVRYAIEIDTHTTIPSGDTVDMLQCDFVSFSTIRNDFDEAW